MSELLAPAGNMDALKAAIANGADAVYLGMQKFGARAYSDNFNEETLAEAVDYAHLRGVKVYATMNTIVFQDELEDAYRQLHFLNSVGVDGVITQDLALLTYVARTFQDMEAHCSTQMGIDDVQGATLVKELGAARTVIGREVPIDQVKAIRAEADLPVEIFVHGALCVSYSGNCIMSGMTGNRLGNRGRCIGSCRKLYDILDADTGESLGRNYILSTKDLCTIDHADQLDGIDSLKIEGRMKEPVYVANVVSRYRMALDGAATAADKELLNRTFNRTFTKGYLFGEDRGSITNVDKPNHHGYRIGSVAGFRKGMCELKLTDELRQNDVIRIRHNNEDVNLSVAKLYDAKGKLINSATKSCFIKVKERLSAGDAVYKTKDLAYTKELESKLTGEFRRFPLDCTVYAYPGAPLVVEAKGLGQQCTFTGDETLSEAINNPTGKDAAVKQFSRLNDTVFALGEVTFESDNAFVPAKLFNTARKWIVQELCQQALAAKPRRLREHANGEDGEGASAFDASTAADGAIETNIPTAADNANAAAAAAASTAPEPTTLAASATADDATRQPYLTAYATTREQADACREAGLDVVYFENVIPRNDAEYRPLEGEVLVGGLGGVEYYRSTNPFVADYSLNTVNAESCHELHKLGARRVTLSYEINQTQLHDLLDAYLAHYGATPALEMIVYGRAPLLVTKYCPLKKMGQCGTCKTRRYKIQDEFGSFPLLCHDNCDTTVLNGKILNLLDELPGITGIEAFRLQFTTESASEVRSIIELAQAKLANANALQSALAETGGNVAQATANTTLPPAFNPDTDTRGYYRKEIL